MLGQDQICCRMCLLIASTIDASAYSFWQMWVFSSYGTQERRQLSSRVRKLILNRLFREITRRAWIRQSCFLWYVL